MNSDAYKLVYEGLQQSFGMNRIDALRLALEIDTLRQLEEITHYINVVIKLFPQVQESTMPPKSPPKHRGRPPRVTLKS